MTDDATPTPHRPGHRGNAARLRPPAEPLPGRREMVAVQLTGAPAYVDHVASVLMPGLTVGSRGPSATDPAEATITGMLIVGPDLHRYLSTACRHEAVTDDAELAARLHAYCAGAHCGNNTKEPAQCKWCTAPCECPGHQSQVDGSAVNDQ